MNMKVNGKIQTIMKKEIIISILATAVLCGCQNEELSVLNSNSKSFIATIDDSFSGAETKTSLDNQGNVLWKQGDQLSIFAGSTINEQWQVTDASDGKTAAELNKISGAGFNAGGEIDNNVALYPYSSVNTIAKSEGNYVIGIVLPSTQNYAEASFGNGAFPMAAVTSSTTDMNLKFKNILGGLKLQLKGTASIASISISGNNDEILCGAANVTASVSGKPSINLTDGSAKTVTLYCGTGVQLNADVATSFIISLPPMTMSNGFTVVVRDSEGKKMQIQTTKSQIITRSSILKMPVVNYEGILMQDDAEFADQFIVPYGVDVSKITEANFYVSTDKTTETVISCSEFQYDREPVYFELDGTVANYYTKGSKYIIDNANSMFGGWKSLQSLDISTFDTSLCSDFNSMFSGCSSLQELDISNFDTNNATTMVYMFGDCTSLEHIDLSSFTTPKLENMDYMFLHCEALKELDLSSFDTHNVLSMGSTFEYCTNLESLDISSFSSESLNDCPGMMNCFSMLKLNLGNFDLSKFSTNNSFYRLAKRSRNCAISCTLGTKEMMSSAQAYPPVIEYIQWYLPGETLPDLEMQYDPNLYYSTDFSKDKTIKVLQEASTGNGVNLVVVGEAYSDRLIADGTYDDDIAVALDHLFSIEPFKSYRDLFTIHQVYAVSENEQPGEITAIDYLADWGGFVTRNDVAIEEYVNAGFPDVDRNHVTALFIVHEDSRNGMAMEIGGFSDNEYYDYPTRLEGTAFASRASNEDDYKYVVCHEMGHAFAALWEEYVDTQGIMESWESEFMQNFQSHVGWYSNVSFSSNPETIGWKNFLNDSRYSESNVSIIEGAKYSTGIWRSVDQSMMNAGGEYSVPSREAIYKRIHKLAYGDSWQYDYETFVQQDLNITSSAPSRAAKTNTRSYTQSQNRKHIFQMTQSQTPDGKTVINVIMN